MTHFEVVEDDINRLISGYLRKKGFVETLSSLHLETGVVSNKSNESHSREISFIQKLVLEGRWDDLISFLDPMRRMSYKFDEVCDTDSNLVISFFAYKLSLMHNYLLGFS